MDSLRLGTWNLCLGLPNKKDLVTSYLNTNNVDLCCLQETEVIKDFPEHLLSCGGFNLELELNDMKKRAGIYIRNSIKYKRRIDLEVKNCHVVIVDILCSPAIRIICLYRSFRPPGMLSPDVFFSSQLSLLRNALKENCVIMGDFNLDAEKGHRLDYVYKIPMKFLTDFTLEHNLTQLVTFNTWSRTIKGVIKESLLDHVYVNNFAAVSNVTFTVPVFGDHVLVLIDLKTRLFTTNETVIKRNWSGYSPSLMNNNLLNKIMCC